MATKLVKLVNDKKKSLGTNGGAQAGSAKRMRDVDTEEYLIELESKVSDLEMHNKRLKENVGSPIWPHSKKTYILNIFTIDLKLQTCKIQLQTLQTQKSSVSTVYSNVTSRIDTVGSLWSGGERFGSRIK